MPRKPDLRDAGSEELTGSAVTWRLARRPALRAAVFGQRDGGTTVSWPPRPVTSAVGTVLEVTENQLLLQAADGERKLALSPRAKAWRGGMVPPDRLRRGDFAVVRHAEGIVDRVWAGIGRVSGGIVAVDGRELLIDVAGGDQRHQRVVIDPDAFRQLRVRFPRLLPGFLIDVIGTRQQGYLRAVAPATAQPPYRAGHVPAPPPLVGGRIPASILGTAVWHEPGNEPAGLLGIAYPALDPEHPCAEHVHSAGGIDPHAVGSGCVRLPYVSRGSLVRIRNECSHRVATLPVTGCGAAARIFCDRCVECGTPPRGRVADLTMTAFVELGGNLEDGCFNATLSIAALRGRRTDLWG